MYQWRIMSLVMLFLWNHSYANSVLPQEVTNLLNRYNMPSSSLGVYVQAVDSNQPILNVNAGTPFSPASTIKLVTSWAGLELLGPAYTWKTYVYTRGDIISGRLNGHLILKGTGDPFFTFERYWLLLKELRAKGLQDITGNLILDRSHFSYEVSNQSPFDTNIYSPYNVSPNALLFNFQAIRLQFFPEAQQSIARLHLSPEPANLIINNKVNIVGGKCRYSLKSLDINILADNLVELVGNYPLSCGAREISRIIMNNDNLLYGVFQTLWRELGGNFSGSLETATVSPTDSTLYQLDSKPLAEIIRSVNKFSNNVMAQHVFLTLGAENYGPPANFNKSKLILEKLISDKGIYAPELIVENGSGLSRTTQISPKTMASILLSAYRGPYMSELMATLPIAGIDGTLWRKFTKTEWKGKMHLKTGTLRGVKALSGYALSRSGQRYVVVIFINHQGLRYDASLNIQEALLNWVYNQ